MYGATIKKTYHDYDDDNDDNNNSDNNIQYIKIRKLITTAKNGNEVQNGIKLIENILPKIKLK